MINLFPAFAWSIISHINMCCDFNLWNAILFSNVINNWGIYFINCEVLNCPLYGVLNTVSITLYAPRNHLYLPLQIQIYSTPLCSISNATYAEGSYHLNFLLFAALSLAQRYFHFQLNLIAYWLINDQALVMNAWDVRLAGI